MGLIHTDATTLTKVQGSAVGIQPKCYDNGYWYKKNVYGCEDQSEHLASLVLMHSNITNYVFIQLAQLMTFRDVCQEIFFLTTNRF